MKEPAEKLCRDCGQPMKPKNVRKKLNEYDHAQGCRYANTAKDAQKREQWRCYHCNEVFSNRVLAAEHFGDDRKNPHPAKCVGMLQAVFEAFEQYGVHRNFHNAASVKILRNQTISAEREACAEMLDQAYPHLAEAIRARGKA